MDPVIAPEFAALVARLRAVPWFSRVGRPDDLPSLPLPCRIIDNAPEAREAIEQPDWEDWTLERRNDLTSFLHARFRTRYDDWNRIAKPAGRFIDGDLVPRLSPTLARALPDTTVALDAVRWDLSGALMEAAYADCRPPRFFTHLVAIYEAGHLPVGWDAGGDDGTLLVY